LSAGRGGARLGVVRVPVLAASLVALVVSTAAASLAPASPRPAAVVVTPASGSAGTTFTVSFSAPDQTGLFGSLRRYDIAVGSASGSRSRSAARAGCIHHFAARAPYARTRARVAVSLNPRRFGGSWCPGTYLGTVEEFQVPVCPPRELCPAFVLLRSVIGHFSLRVRSPPASGGGHDTTPPSFAGLQSAFACTPGPQRPGETTPFTLSWNSATDDHTPSSQIVYDVYESATSGGENYAAPTWTTPPGVTRFRTPGLPSHGAFFFVVRARDLAGNEDHNTVERRGVDPCV
jgi:hypothetical protein